MSEELQSKDNRASLKCSKMSECLVLPNGDGSQEQRLQGLTSAGIRDAAHQASGAGGLRVMPGTPIRGG